MTWKTLKINNPDTVEFKPAVPSGYSVTISKDDAQYTFVLPYGLKMKRMGDDLFFDVTTVFCFLKGSMKRNRINGICLTGDFPTKDVVYKRAVGDVEIPPEANCVSL